ncbi:MAG: thiamine pyrophosphate-dependent enzyme, partial [Nitriliruptoraceae bacterium]
FWVTHLQVRQPQDFMQTSYVGGAGGIGLSLGAAIGAAIGRPDALVVNCVGDAAHLMALADLDTAARYHVPLVVLISNDQALGAEVHYLSLVGLSTEVAEIAPPDLVAVAQALGAEAMTIDSVADLDNLARRLAEPITGPIVVDCHVDRSVRADWVDMLWGNRVVPLGRT